MSRKALEWAWEARLPPVEKFLLVALSLYADGKNECSPTIEELMQKTCLCRTTVFKGITTLEKLGILTKNKEKKRSQKGHQNCYQLHLEKEGVLGTPDTPSARHTVRQTDLEGTPDGLHSLYSITRIVMLSLNKNLATAFVFSFFVQLLDRMKIPAAAADFDQHREAKKAIPKIPPCPYQDIVALYRKWLPMCPSVFSLSETRKKYIQARWREYPSLDNFDKFFKWVSKSRFLTGQVSGRQGAKPFVASLEWLMRPENFLKVLEHKYHE